MQPSAGGRGRSLDSALGELIDSRSDGAEPGVVIRNRTRPEECVALLRQLLAGASALLISATVLWWLLSDEVIAALARSLPGAPLWQLVLAASLVPVIQAIRAWRFTLLAAGPFWTMYGVAAKLDRAAVKSERCDWRL